jgi:hypothetical protein
MWHPYVSAHCRLPQSQMCTRRSVHTLGGVLRSRLRDDELSCFMCGRVNCLREPTFTSTTRKVQVGH